MTLARLSGDLIVLEISHRETHLAKAVPGARFHARGDEHLATGHFVYPLSWGTCLALRGVFGDGLQIDAGLAEWARERSAVVSRAKEIRSKLELDEPDHGLDDRLRGYQQVGAAFLRTAERAILADEMRLGKTPTSLAAGRALGALPALVVSPNSVKFQWRDAVAAWWPEATSVVIKGSAGERRAAIEAIASGEATIGIINWESLRLHSRIAGFGSAVGLARCERHGGDGSVSEAKCEAHPKELNEIDWQLVIADEAHRAAHPRAKQTRALWAIAENAPYRWALTGTPVLSSPEDLWSLGHWIAPEEFPSKTTFLDRYGLVGWNPFGGLEVLGLKEATKAELFNFLDARFIRRTRSMVMQWLPEKIYTERTVELNAKQRKAYNAMRDEMLAELEDGAVTYVTNALTKLTRLRQFASAYGAIEEGGNLVLTAPSCKVEAMLEIAEELGGKPAVVFAESKQLINLAGAALAKAGYDVGYITGDVAADDREVNVKNFQRGDLDFLLITLGAGGEGLTLDRADVAVFLQRSFSLAKNLQAEDRIVGQEAGPGLEIIDIVAQDTVEARVREVLNEKAAISEEIVRDAETYRRLLG